MRRLKAPESGRATSARAMAASNPRRPSMLLLSLVAVTFLAQLLQRFGNQRNLLEFRTGAAIQYHHDATLHPSSSSSLDFSSEHRRKVVLLGPHDRFNFGDLLFEKVVSKLLVERAGYRPEDLIRAGIVTTDMSEFGGASSIFSLKTIQKLSFASKEPFDIIYLGGEAAGCDHEFGVTMMASEALMQSAREDKVYDCAYLFPKDELVPPSYTGSSNMAVVNSMGRMVAIPSCQRAIDSADYRSFRNPIEDSNEKLVPDSAVMTRTLFGSYLENVDNFPEIKDILSKGDYIAVQHKTGTLDPDALVAALDPVARETNSSIVFFAAGTVPRHDSFDVYHRVADKLNATTYVLDHEPNVWKVVATIAHAKAVFSTSLHVRIMGFQFQKPRITWCPNGGKHYHFIKSWEQLQNDNICFEMSQTAAALRRSVPMDEARINNITEAYLASFDEWSNMLLHGHRKRLGNVTLSNS